MKALMASLARLSMVHSPMLPINLILDISSNK